jgi:hypothetical protein
MVTRFTFPDHEHAPTESLKTTYFFGVTLLVLLELGEPKVLIPDGMVARLQSAWLCQ